MSGTARAKMDSILEATEQLVEYVKHSMEILQRAKVSWESIGKAIKTMGNISVDFPVLYEFIPAAR